MQRGSLLVLTFVSALVGCAGLRPAASPLPAAAPLAASPHLVPMPQALQLQPGELSLADAVAVTADAGAVNARRDLDALLAGLSISQAADAATGIQLELVRDAALGEEGYRLSIGDDIRLQAQNDAGLLHGVQTLRQLLPARTGQPLTLPRLEITDVPRYAWRGVSLDVARSFLPIEYLEKHIDRMALFKLNRLHLHLTDDQGWRVQIKKYPRLTEIGGASAVKGGRAGFYTQDELRNLVAYAQQRGVTIVPEVDMPGHVQAALASYNELACDGVRNLSTYSGVEVGFSVLCLRKPEVVYPFVRGVLEELVDIFPSEYIHIGGDEIKDPLYADFVARAAAIVRELGRKPVAWEEASVAQTNPDLRLQLWNDGYAIQPAVARGHQLILSPCSYLYLDHGNYAGQPQTYDWCRKQGVPLQRVYEFDPGKFGAAAGVEAALWSEVVHDDAAADNRLWPRLAAVAEVAWSPASVRNFDDFTRRMGQLRGHLDALGVGYYPDPALGW